MTIDKLMPEIDTKIATLEGNVALMLKNIEKLEQVYNAVLDAKHSFSSAARMAKILSVIGEEIDAQDKLSANLTRELEWFRLLKRWLSDPSVVDVEKVLDAALISSLCS